MPASCTSSNLTTQVEVWRGGVGSNEERVNHFAPEMPDGDMRLLHSGGSLCGYDNGQVALRSQWLTGNAGQADAFAADRAGALDRFDYVCRLATGADGNQKVSGNAQGPHLSRKNFLKTVIVTERRKRRRVSRERDGGKGAPGLLVTSDQLGRNVLRIGGTAAIAAKQDLSSRSERIADEATCLFDLAEPGIEQSLDCCTMLFE